MEGNVFFSCSNTQTKAWSHQSSNDTWRLIKAPCKMNRWNFRLGCSLSKANRLRWENQQRLVCLLWMSHIKLHSASLCVKKLHTAAEEWTAQGQQYVGTFRIECTQTRKKKLQSCIQWQLLPVKQVKWHMTWGSNLIEKLKFGGGIFSTVGWMSVNISKDARRVCVFCLLKRNVWGASWSNWRFFFWGMCWWCRCFVWSEKWTDGADQNNVWTHCMLDRESLAAKELSEDLQTLWTLSSFNFIKKGALHTPLCDTQRVSHCAPLPSEVRCLTRGWRLAH